MRPFYPSSCLVSHKETPDPPVRAVGFGMGDLADACAGINTVDVVGRPVFNTFRGRTSIELHLKDVAWE